MQGNMLDVPKKPEPNDGLSSREVERRVAILKRFRELLSQQRSRFQQYLLVLDKQKDIIENGNPDDLIVHVELEEKIIGDIFAIQKVIDPLEAMYQAHITETLPGEIREVPSLKAALEELRSEAVIRSAQNRSLLGKRMEELRREMKTLRANPYTTRRSAFSRETPTLVDIKG